MLLRGWVGRSRASRAGPWMARHGVPPQQCRSEGTVEPERGGRMAGQGPFAYFWGCLPKVSRRKGGTRKRPSHIKRIRTPLLQQEHGVPIRHQRLTERWGSLKFPRSGPAPWARRGGPSLVQHGCRLAAQRACARCLSSFMLQNGLIPHVLVRCAPTFRRLPPLAQTAAFPFFDVRHPHHAQADPAQRSRHRETAGQ